METVSSTAQNNTPHTVIDLFSTQVAATPERIAVVGTQGALTFRQLDNFVRQAAYSLVEQGVEPDQCVGIYVDSSLDMMVGTLAILAAGCAYLPLAPEYPGERIRYMIEDAGLAVIFTQPELLPQLQRLGLPGVTFITAASATATASDIARFAPARIDEAAVAYVIYTSGTTGKPKGVEIEHGSLVNQLLWLRDTYGIDATQTVLRKTPMSFDAAQWELLAVALGAKVVMADTGLYRDPAAMVAALQAYGVTALQCVPTLLQALVDEPGFERCSTLRGVFSGGEPLTRKLAMRCLQVLPDTTLVNLYGPTECTINSSSMVVDWAYLEHAPNVIAIGYPVANTHYHIVDPESGVEIQAAGEVGELLIGGRQVARGYLRRPEQTHERFVDRVFSPDIGLARHYRTGDLVSWNRDGSVQFCGRTDHQIKLRGHRIELDEIRLAIENHPWVKSAAAFVRRDEHSGHQSLVACIALNPREAALMDQGQHGAHHLSKSSRVQVKAQLGQLGFRDATQDDWREVVSLPGKRASAVQRARAFARKTYRFFEGEALTRQAIIDLLQWRVDSGQTADISALTPFLLGELLRNLGPFASQERLLDKYAYASPGALYAHQLYLDITAIAGIPCGLYYFAPARHELVLIRAQVQDTTPGITLHLVGKESTIEAVYKNNVAEVLEMEAGHVLGLLDCVLPEYGLGLAPGTFDPQVLTRLACGAGHRYLGSFALVSRHHQDADCGVDILVQAHPGQVADLPAGLYRYDQGQLHQVGEGIVERKDVIAINQRTYQQASFGLSLTVSQGQGWDHYLRLGRRLQVLQMNDLHIGLMSSGYSSKSGNDLATARRLRSLLAAVNQGCAASYFALAGGVSHAQVAHEGMKEDSVHVQGPAEVLKEELENVLPHYMVPNQFVVMDDIPLSANGKVDVEALKSTAERARIERACVAPRNALEQQIAAIWQEVMHSERVSVEDDFFEVGGNSLLAVVMINRINQALATRLALQVIFTHPSVAALATRVADEARSASSRLVALNAGNPGARPIYCWPGLGGYPMNLRGLAKETGTSRPFYGVQAVGINEGEAPEASIAEMARKDVALLRARQPQGPYALWGYSFGARVAYEAAWQLEQMGETVDELVLIAPGNPQTRQPASRRDGHGRYCGGAFLGILYSVFAGALPNEATQAVLEQVGSQAEFVSFMTGQLPGLDQDLVTRVTEIVELTYEFKYSFRELLEHRLQVPIVLLKAVGDDYSFLEEVIDQLAVPPAIVTMAGDHYGVLKGAGVEEVHRCVALGKRRLLATVECLG